MDDKVSIYPNTASDYINIVLCNASSGLIDISVYNSSGTLILRQTSVDAAITNVKLSTQYGPVGNCLLKIVPLLQLDFKTN